MDQSTIQRPTFIFPLFYYFYIFIFYNSYTLYREFSESIVVNLLSYKFKTDKLFMCLHKKGFRNLKDGA